MQTIPQIFFGRLQDHDNLATGEDEYRLLQ